MAAIGDFTEAIRLNPNYAEVYNNRGSAYANENEYDNAIRDYTEAIRLNHPAFAEAAITAAQPFACSVVQPLKRLVGAQDRPSKVLRAASKSMNAGTASRTICPAALV